MTQPTNGQTVPEGQPTAIELTAYETASDFLPGQSHIIASTRSIVTMTGETVERIKLLARMMAESSFNNSRNPLKSGDYFLIMLKGLAVGLDPIVAVDFISVIQGKPVIDGKGLLALILNAKKSGEVEDLVIDSQETHCSVTIKRKGMTPHTETFSMDDARKMKTTSWVDGKKMEIPLAEKDNWKQQPRTMLKWRAVAACARACCADIIGGLYSKEEISDGDVIVMENGAMHLPPPPSQNGASRPTSRQRTTASATNNGTKPIITPDFSTGESPKNGATPAPQSDEPDPNDPEDIRHAIPIYGEEHWYVKHYHTFVSQLRPYIKDGKKMANHEISSAGLRLINKPTWVEFATGADAIKAVHERVNANKAPAPTPAPAPVQTVTPPADFSSDFEDWLWTWLDCTIDQWGERTGKALSDYANLQAAIADTTQIAQRDAWDMVVTEAKYVKADKQTYIEFQGIVPVRMYGRSTTFKKQVGDAYYARYDVGNWQADKIYTIGLLKVAWKPNEYGTPLAQHIEVIEEDEVEMTPEEMANIGF